MNILWGMGYQQYENIRDKVIAQINATYPNPVFVEKHSKRGIVNELKNPTVVKMYDLAIIFEYVEKVPFECSLLEEIIDNCSNTTIVYCLSTEHRGDSYVQSLIGIGFVNCLFVSELSADKILSLRSNPRTRLEAKFYLGLTGKSVNGGELIEKEVLARLIHNLSRQNDEDKINTFREIASQYSEDELFYIVKFFPTDLLEVLKEEPFVFAYLKAQQPTEIKRNTEKGFNINLNLNLVGSPVERLIGYNRAVISVIGCAEFAAEFAYNAAKTSSIKVLYINLDTNEFIEYYLGRKSYITKKLFDIDSFDEEKVQVLGNLFAVSIETGLFELEHMKYDSVIAAARQKYDLIILSVSREINNLALSCISNSDYCVYPFYATVPKLKSINDYLNYMIEVKGIPREKFFLVSYDHGKHSISVDLLKDLYKESFLACIPFSHRRQEIVNGSKNTFAARVLYKENKKVYLKILYKFNIVPKPSLFEKMADALKLGYKYKNKVTVLQEETEDLRDKIEKVSEAAIKDPLTGLYNRYKFTGEYKKVAEATTIYSVILMDIDHFKKVNDTYGHNAGDVVLKSVSAALLKEKEKRKNDVLARWGGEEFIILLPGANESTAFEVADKARQLIEGLAIEEVGKVTASFGVSQNIPEDALEKIVERADQALYKAKQTGRNRVVVYSSVEKS